MEKEMPIAKFKGGQEVKFKKDFTKTFIITHVIYVEEEDTWCYSDTGNMYDFYDEDLLELVPAIIDSKENE